MNGNGVPDLSELLKRPPHVPFEVMIVPFNNTQLLMSMIVKGFEPMNVFVGPVTVERDVEVEVEGVKKIEKQKGQVMDYVVWLKKTNSPLATPTGKDVG